MGQKGSLITIMRLQQWPLCVVDAFFVVGKNPNVGYEAAPYGKIPDELGM